MPCRVGIMAYNEGPNIASALASLRAQVGPHLASFTVTVVASGCTDETVPIVRRTAAVEPRVRLLEQPHREGKSSAIRAFLRDVAASDVAVLAGADTHLEPGALEALVAPLDDPTVGMTGGRPVPVNSATTPMGRVVHLLWELHHRVAARVPKLGELVAFRPEAAAALGDTAVDEASIEALVRRRGLRLVYVPEARVRMKGPSTVADYLAQRRRIHAGHLRLRRTTGHRVSTLSLLRILSAIRAIRSEGGGSLASIAGAAVLEGTARVLGAYDELVGRDHDVWKPILSTKDLSS